MQKYTKVDGPYHDLRLRWMKSAWTINLWRADFFLKIIGIVVPYVPVHQNEMVDGVTVHHLL